MGRVPGVPPLYWAGVRARFAVERRIARWRDRRRAPAGPRPRARLSVILLSFERPRNIQAIADTVLACDFVDRLVISNNNPRIRLQDALRLSSSRVCLLEQEQPCPPMKRFEIARELTSEYFLALDDDVFLSAAQIEALFAELVADPDSPHGIAGQVMRGESACPGVLAYHLVQRRAARVDVLNRTYLFTAAHRDRFFVLLEELYGRDPQRKPLRYGDDIVLSHCGSRPPMVHDVGRVLYCPSSDDPVIARWLQPGFHEYRSAVYRDVVALTSRRGSLAPLEGRTAG
jgi:hypothetical protein